MRSVKANRPQQIQKLLGEWNLPDHTSVNNPKQISIEKLYQIIEKYKKAMDTLYGRIHACVKKHEGAYTRIMVDKSSYTCCIRVIGIRKETSEEVKRRLSKEKRQISERARYEQRRRESTLNKLLDESPDLVRKALSKYDKDLWSKR